MESYDFSRLTHYVASVAIVNDGKILMLKQNRTHFWLLPGGHIDDGELPHEAVLREVLEETNLKIELLQKPEPDAKTEIATPIPIPFGMRTVPCRDKIDIDMIFIAKVVSGELKIDHESEEARWFTKQEIIDNPNVGPSNTFYALKALEGMTDR